jgi:dipeptidyl aminopeptidase/acylaminoacyl peptidase
VFRNLGTPEIESLDAAVEYLVTKCGVDRKRIGLYGHSQGAYVTLMALFMRPGKFAVGAAQAPPIDNAHLPTFYDVTRILNIPWQEPEVYKRTSPIYYADKLQDRLIIFHGINDTNVPIQETFRLAQRFIELGKTGWEVAVYPTESHVPRQAASRLDIERRRFALFESVLKTPASAGRKTARRSKGEPGGGHARRLVTPEPQVKAGAPKASKARARDSGVSKREP